MRVSVVFSVEKSVANEMVVIEQAIKESIEKGLAECGFKVDEVEIRGVSLDFEEIDYKGEEGYYEG